MSRTTHTLHFAAALAALPAAATVAWGLGDSRGVGLMLGVIFAITITLVGWIAQARSLRAPSSSANGMMTAFALAFLAKLFIVALGAVVLRLHDGLGARADWRAYLVGFAAAVAWGMFVGAFRRFGAARTPKEASASC